MLCGRIIRIRTQERQIIREGIGIITLIKNIKIVLAIIYDMQH